MNKAVGASGALGMSLGLVLLTFVAATQGCTPKGSGGGGTGGTGGAGGMGGAGGVAGMGGSISSGGGMGGAGDMGGAGGVMGTGGAGGAMPGGSLLWLSVLEDPMIEPGDSLNVTGIAASSNGTIKSVGLFQGIITLSPTNWLFSTIDTPRAFAVSLDSAGNPISGYHEPIADQPSAPRIVPAGDKFVVGQSNTDFYGVPYSAIKAPSWSKEFHNLGFLASVQLSSFAWDNAGNVVSLHTSYGGGTVDYGGGPLGDGSHLVKHDATGNHVFSKYSPGYGQLMVDPSGDIFMARRDIGQPLTVVKLDASGNPIWTKSFTAPSGQNNSPTFGYALDASGELLLAVGFTGNADVGGGPVTSVGTHDLLIAKLDAAGNHLWSKHFGAPGFALERLDVKRTGTGDLVVAGQIAGTVDLGGGPLQGPLFVAKFDGAGNLVWQKPLTDTSFSFVTAGDPSGAVLIASTSKTLDLGAGPPLAGKLGFFVAKLSP